MKQTVAFLLLFLLTLTCYQSQAQRETENWYFGNMAGLRFNVPTQTILTNSKLNTPEGCSTISDSLGNLLFYTDGIKVWNKQHQQMPNGFGLKGDPSSSQSALIVKKPGSNLIYYIFTVAARAETPGLRYSEVNLALDGGFGDVTTKNTLLLTPATEKITAVNHRQDEDVWVVAHKWNDSTFYTYPVTAAGVGSPVLSPVGSRHTGIIDNALGCLKASPDGTKIALAIQTSSTFELFDFDDRTGRLSNPVRLSNLLFNWAYGVEFSPDATKLFCTSMGIPGAVFQFDLSDPHPDSIRKSLYTVGRARKSLYGALQLASNGRIYIAAADSNMLSVIQAPNKKAGDNRFFEAGVFLQNGLSKFGLPSFNQNFFLVPNFKYDDICFGDTMYFELRVPYKFQSVSYNFNDPGSGSENTSALFNPKHYFTKPGNYDVVTTGPINNGRIRTTTTRVVVHPLPPVNLGADTVLCPGDTIYLTTKGTYKKYKWNTDSTDKVLLVTQPGLYWLEVTSSFGCVDRDSILVTSGISPVALISKREEICFGEAATFKTVGNGIKITWPDGSIGTEYQTVKSGYQPIQIHKSICTYADSIEVVYKNCPEKHFFPNIITPDNDGLNDQFRILGIQPGQAELTIFNRYGNRVFHTTGYNQNWNGSDVSAGLYFYYFRLPETNQIIKGWLEVVK